MESTEQAGDGAGNGKGVERGGLLPVSRAGEKRLTEARWQRKVRLPSQLMEKGAVRLKY